MSIVRASDLETNVVTEVDVDPFLYVAQRYVEETVKNDGEQAWPMDHKRVVDIIIGEACAMCVVWWKYGNSLAKQIRLKDQEGRNPAEWVGALRQQFPEVKS
jgi:hypothetical protein